MAQKVVLDPECEKEREQLRHVPSPRLSGLAAEWKGDTIEIHFTPGGEGVAVESIHALPRTNGAALKARVDWYQLGVLLLILSSAVAAAIRLLGSQP
jgi:hypothetical protein